MALRGPLLPASSTALLASIVLLAVVLRTVYFVGLVSGDPQDDGVYYGNAFALYSEGPTYLERYRHLPPDFLANPIDQFNFRPMITYPIAAAFALFGPGELPAVLWAFVCSLGTVVVVYRLGVVLHGPAVGLVAALLCAFYPLEVINGTRILSDVQLGLFASLSLLSIVEGAQRRRLAFYVLAGVAVAGAYLANGRGLLVLALLVGGATLQAVWRQTDWRAPLCLLGGFSVVFAVEATIYGLTTGDPFLNYRIHDQASRFKYLYEPVATVPWGRLHIKYTNGRPFELLETVFLGIHRPVDQFGYYFFFFAAAVVHSVVRRANRLLVVLAAGLFLYFEFGPRFVSIDWARGELDYLMIFKQERFLLTLTAPLVVTAAFFLVTIGRRSYVVAGALLVILFATSLSAIDRTRDHYRAGLADLRAVTPRVLERQDRLVFSDLWAIEHLKIFSGYRAHNLRVLDQRSQPSDLGPGCILLGGSRGVELMAEYVESTLPAFVRGIEDAGRAPPGWTAVATFAGPRNPFRRIDLTLYCLAA